MIIIRNIVDILFEIMTFKSQTSGLSGPSDGNFNEYDGRNYRGDLPPY